MIFVCIDEFCSTAVESGEMVYKCPNCGKKMKQLKEEELDGVQWSELGIFWRDQKSEEADKRAFECFKMAAKEGDACGISNLGLCYEHGYGVKVDNRQAYWLYKQAVEYEYVPAYSHLGDCYVFGKGTGIDLEEAFKYYMFAAEHGYVPAELRVGRAYELGQGTEKNTKEAWLCRAWNVLQIWKRCRGKSGNLSRLV